VLVDVDREAEFLVTNYGTGVLRLGVFVFRLTGLSHGLRELARWISKIEWSWLGFIYTGGGMWVVLWYCSQRWRRYALCLIFRSGSYM